MIVKIIASILIAIYYIGYVLYKKKDNDKLEIIFLSISLLVYYIIYLLLIWRVV